MGISKEKLSFHVHKLRNIPKIVLMTGSTIPITLPFLTVSKSGSRDLRYFEKQRCHETMFEETKVAPSPSTK